MTQAVSACGGGSLNRIRRHTGQRSCDAVGRRFARRIRGYAKANNVPVVNCSAGERKHDIAEDYLARTTIAGACSSSWSAGHRRRCGMSAPIITSREAADALCQTTIVHILDAEWGQSPLRSAAILRSPRKNHAKRPRVCSLPGNARARHHFSKQGNCFNPCLSPRTLAKIAETLSEQRTLGRLSQLCDRWIYSTCLVLRGLMWRSRG